MTSIHDVEGAKAYLLQHKLHTLFESLAADVISKRPEKPHEYLIERIASLAKAEGIVTTKGTATATGPMTTTSPAASSKRKLIFVLGGPGSGKGTQCDLIVAQMGFLHVSAGDLLRAEVASGSDEGKSLEALMKEGKLVPDATTIGLLKKWIDSKPENATILVDGFPRSMKQALQFEEQIGPAVAVLFFSASNEVLTNRLLKRGMTSGRADDNLDSIGKRLVTFQEQSKPVTAYFAAKDRCIELDAEKKKEEIFEAVKKGLQPFL